MRRRGGGAGTREEEAGLVEGGKVKGIGGELNIGDDVVLHGERQLHPTPVELGGALSGEALPLAILPLGRGELLIEGADLWTGNKLVEIENWKLKIEINATNKSFFMVLLF